MPEVTPGDPSEESPVTLSSIIQEFALSAARREEAIQRIQDGLPIDIDWFASPSVLLLNAAPGLGKTYALVKEAERLWKSLPVLHLGPTHDSFENVERISPEDTPGGIGWGHWQGHDDGRKSGTPCPRSIRAQKGYTSGNECSPTCNYTPPKFTGVPTFAPVDYILNMEQLDRPLDLEQLMFSTPLTPHAISFPWWVIDDVGLDRFIGKREVTKLDFDRTAEGYPKHWAGADIIRQLTTALSTLLGQHTTWVSEQDPQSHKSWSGHELYERLDAVLREQGSGVHLPTSLAGLEPSNDPWPTVDLASPADWPQNFMPHLIPKMMTESAAWFNTKQSETVQEFQPHLHVVWDPPEAGGPLQSFLRIRWRKRPSLLRSILILDATGKIDLLAKAFRGFGPSIQQSAPVDVPPFPCTMKVRQYWGHHLNRKTLSSVLGVDDHGPNQVISETYRKLLIQEISKRRSQSSKQLKVGLITFKRLVEDGTAALLEAGINADDIVSDYYWNIRGSNSFTDCNIVVLMGYPIPNPQGIFEDACVLYDGEMPPISRDSEYFAREMHLRNGQTISIDSIPGYKDERLQALYEQMSLSELYQAFHRARPFAPSTSVEEVLMFTDVPVKGVPVDGFFCQGRHGRAFDTLVDLLASNTGVVTVPQLVDAIKDANPDLEPTRKAVDTWVRRPASVQWLENATASEYTAGTSKSNPGAFRRPA